MGNLFSSIFSKSEKSIANTPLGRGWQQYIDTGYGNLGEGNALTKEGLGGLRSLDSTYQQRLSDPLGSVGRGIFARARGQLSSDAQRRQGAFGARLTQQALQSGGTMSPEAQAELQANNQRSTNESLFSAQNDLANQEAGMTLSETSKLFDRMEGIRKTIVGVGQDEKTQALQSILAGLTGQTGRMQTIIKDILGPWGSSREIKHDVVDLSTETAIDVLAKLRPVLFTYDETEEQHAGFIAEEVPEVVAQPGRKTVNSMDFIAVLTAVVKEQQETIQGLAAKVEQLEKGEMTWPSSD